MTVEKNIALDIFVGSVSLPQEYDIKDCDHRVWSLEAAIDYSLHLRAHYAMLNHILHCTMHKKKSNFFDACLTFGCLPDISGIVA